MKIGMWLLRINSIVFGLYGLAFLLFPELLSLWVTGSVPDSESGLIDMRATYGGLFLAIGIWLFILSKNNSSIKSSLVGVLLIMMFMAGGRSYGMIMDGSPNHVMYLFLVLEVLMATLTYWVLGVIKNKEQPPSDDR